MPEQIEVAMRLPLHVTNNRAGKEQEISHNNLPAVLDYCSRQFLGRWQASVKNDS